MSLYEQLTTNIKNIVEKYTRVVSEKYQLDENELLELFYGNFKESTTKSSTKSSTKSTTNQKLDNVDTEDLSVERLTKCNKTELNALCKTKGLKCSGTKEALIQRLLGKEEQSEQKKPMKKTPVKTPVKTEKKPSIIENLLSDKKNKLARRNEFGNWFFPGTRIVLNQKLCAIGFQEEDGTVSELTDDGIEECKKYKITYKIPNNLDKKIDLENVSIRELEEDGIEENQEQEAEEIEEIEEIEEDE